MILNKQINYLISQIFLLL